tara:strand:- start:2161 stop:4545 length:2385 start_codon:yes stop_codon:yes gene_type:complete
VSDLEKDSFEYGLKISKAIESEWFHGLHTSRYYSLKRKFHELRLYARGEQTIQKYKDELSINGDLSYLNLDWTPVPIISKFVDIVVNGMSERSFEVKAYSQDQYGVEKRTEYMESILRDMQTKEIKDAAIEKFNMDFYENDKDTIPETTEELELHMQLNYKQAVEIAEEQAINVLLDGNKFDLTRNRVLRDIVVLGIGAIKTNFNFSQGATVEYVDPANLVYSNTDSPYFDDIYYVGEIKTIPINELVREFPNLSQEELKDIEQQHTTATSRSARLNQGSSDRDKNRVQVLYFNYKTYTSNTYKVKTTASGAEKAIEKPDTFNPPADKQGDFIRISRQVECLYEGVSILGTDKLLRWRKADNMMRTKSDFNKVRMNYSIVAPRMYDNKIESLVSRITGFADMIQLTHLKLQQVLSKMVPDGVYLDADGLAEIDLGNGTNYNPQEALNMFFQTGSVIGRSFTSDGDQNPGKIPIQQITNAGGGQKMQSLIQTYNYYLQMIRDVTGLNEARDASTPDSRSLVGVQKLAAANSNVATRHILNSMLFLTAETCENLSLRISDIIEYSPTKEAFIQAIGAHNVATLEEMSELYLYDFGIFITLEPDEEEKQKLENNIQMALQGQLIDLDDAIDLREIKNLKTANQLLKLKKIKKQEKAQADQQKTIEAQASANAEASKAAAEAETQKKQALVQTEIQLETAKNKLKLEYMQQEAALKKGLMEFEFELNQRLQDQQKKVASNTEAMKEDRKDKRVRMQASQQSELIEQRKKGTPPKKFESAGNDELGTGAGIDIGGLTGQ